MVSSIFDIAPPCEIVSIDGKEVKVTGVPLRIVVQMAKESPELLSMFMGGGIDAEWLVSKAPGAIALLIAAGFGAPDDEKVRDHAANLPLDTQLDLLRAIFKATTGGGAGPFIEKVAGLRSLMATGQEKESDQEKTQAQPSQPPSNSSSEPEAIPELKYGT